MTTMKMEVEGMKLLMYFSNLKFSHTMAAEDMLLFNSINQENK